MPTGNVLVLNDCQCYVGPYDLTGQANQVAVQPSAAMLDATTYASGGDSEFRPGLRSTSGTIATYLDESLIGTGLDVGTESLVVTTVLTNDEFAVGYSYSGVSVSAGDETQVGQLLRRNHEFRANGKAWSGQLLLPNAARTSGASGSARQLGAVSAAQRVYASLHAFDVTGGNLIVKVQSDDNSGFTSATDRITFSTLTDAGSQLSSAAGAITDDYWRVTFTMTASAATFAVLVGIQ